MLEIDGAGPGTSVEPSSSASALMSQSGSPIETSTPYIFGGYTQFGPNLPGSTLYSWHYDMHDEFWDGGFDAQVTFVADDGVTVLQTLWVQVQFGHGYYQ